MNTEITVGCYTASALSTAAVINMNGIQSVLSIVCMIITILGVLIPGILKLIAIIKKAVEDKKITAEELDQIADAVKDLADDVDEKLNIEKKD